MGDRSLFGRRKVAVCLEVWWTVERSSYRVSAGTAASLPCSKRPGIWKEKKSPLFRSVDKHRQRTANPIKDYEPVGAWKPDSVLD